IPGALALSIDVSSAAVRARVSEALLEAGGVGPRTVLESSTAPLFARRTFQVLHAGAVTGPAGAVVLRGPSGAGKSTLAAACQRAGLAVLGDESLLVG